jgi:hypothetical protein
VVTQCPPIQFQINNVLHEGICHDSFIGVYIIWISQYLTTFFLFLLTIMISLIYQYFGTRDMIGSAREAAELYDGHHTATTGLGREAADLYDNHRTANPGTVEGNNLM